ncbi:type II secretion system protein [Patescibacteria group bacterium]|nr:type II secretion system protein [Patescibacteria group bacterium]
MKKGFTLVEILIVVLIFAILSSLLFKTYIAITRVAFRLEQEKNVSDSIVTISRIVQNFADRNTIDYTAYDLSDLEQNDGASDVLHLQ